MKKTFTIWIQFCGWSRCDGYIVARRYGHTVERVYFKNHTEQAEKLETVKDSLRAEGATHFKISVN